MTAAETAAVVDSPVGHLRLVVRGGALVAVDWTNVRADGDIDEPVLREAASQLRAYFAGERRKCDLPLAPEGSDHQHAVWRYLVTIPFGETRTYADVAGAVGSHARAAANACGANPIPIVIPCHRVTGSGGSFGGFSGGEGRATKRKLLDLEGHGLPLFQTIRETRGEGAP